MAKQPAKTNEYDPRREGLVVEKRTKWPDQIQVTEHERQSIGLALHRDPEKADRLSYVRCPTGLIRLIEVTQLDVNRIFDLEAESASA